MHAPEAAFIRLSVEAVEDAQCRTITPRGRSAPRPSALPRPLRAITPGQSAFADTGIGIQPEQLVKPVRPVGARTRARAIKKGLIEAMGGTVEVDSTVGVGTAIVIELGAAESPGKQRPLSPSEREFGRAWRPRRQTEADPLHRRQPLEPHARRTDPRATRGRRADLGDASNDRTRARTPAPPRPQQRCSLLLSDAGVIGLGVAGGAHAARL